MSEKHIFAIYFPDLGKTPQPYRCTSDDPLFHRLTRVMRSEPGDTVMLFNQQMHVTATVTALSKKELVLHLGAYEPNEELKPHITMLVSITKQDALEEAAYACAEFGASVVQPIITEKAYRQTLPEHSVQRLQTQIIAGAEQAKNFAFPTLKEPITLTEVLANTSTAIPGHATYPLFFDPEGQPLAQVLSEITQKKPSRIVAFVGPEGDLTASEKALLTDAGFLFCALTPTILRAPSATALGLGILRAYLQS